MPTTVPSIAARPDPSTVAATTQRPRAVSSRRSSSATLGPRRAEHIGATRIHCSAYCRPAAFYEREWVQEGFQQDKCVVCRASVLATVLESCGGLRRS